MCLSPIQIYNPSKYISLKHGDPFKLVVPCNKCADCQKSKSAEWHFRMNYMFKDCLSKGGYVLFETLTYRDKDLPFISEFIDTAFDYPCFNRSHIRHFFVKLRRMLEYRGFGHFKYFLVSEYGTDPLRTHRPHYHILFFVDSGIDPLILCRLIHKAWKYGETDWSFHNDDYMLNKRVFKDFSLHGMRLANYVAKYVQKDSEFMQIVDKRIESIVRLYYPSNSPDDIINARSLRIKLNNIMGQFHLQSKGFGLSFLDSPEFDMSELFKTGMVRMLVPDNINLYKHIPLPMYYFRHLFQRQIEVDGKRVWELTLDGVEYRKASEIRKHYNFVKHISDWKLNVPLSLPSELVSKVNEAFTGILLDDLASYVLFMRGRYLTDITYQPLSYKLLNRDIHFYHYGSANDYLIYGKKFVTNKYLGNDVNGYDSFPLYYMERKDFSYKYTYHDSKYEYAYQVYLNCCRFASLPKQNVFDYRQKLEKLYKEMFARV